VFAASALAAQPVVHFSIDAAAARTSVNGGEFIESQRGKLLLAIGGQLEVGLQGAPVQLIVGATAERFRNGDKVNLICIIGSHGQCLSGAPNLRGIVGIAGLRYEPIHGLSLLGALGWGYLGSSGADGNTPTNGRAAETRLELRVHPLSTVEIGLRWQSVRVPDYPGASLTSQPVSLVISVR
jgi:hypothetical protein